MQECPVRFLIAEFGLRIWLAAQQVDQSVRFLTTDFESAIRNPQSDLARPWRKLVEILGVDTFKPNKAVVDF